MKSVARIDDARDATPARSDSWPWQVTETAAEEYRKTVDPSLSVTAAWRLLEKCLPASELLPELTRRGQQRWRLPGAEAVVAVCKPDPVMRCRIAVTVLGPRAYIDDGAVADDVIDAYRRATARVPSAPISGERLAAIAPVRRARPGLVKGGA